MDVCSAVEAFNTKMPVPILDGAIFYELLFLWYNGTCIF